MTTSSPDHLALLAALAERGVATSAWLQAALRKSQPTLSRLLADLSGQVLTLGQGKRTRYALPRSIQGQSAEQPLWWVHEDGRLERFGRLTFVAGAQLHVEGDGIDSLSQALPWFLAPLKAQGFLGRLLALRLASRGVDANPDRWSLEQTLAAALELHDPTGAIVIGEPRPGSVHAGVDATHPGPAFDALAADVAATLPAGSSAGGEQAKFLARTDAGEHLIVKFTPPRGTPFGERWSDLLHTEALALAVLAEWGVDAAPCELITTPTRTYLASKRFDRAGATGRRHVVPLDAVHDAFVPVSRRHWGATCEALARQRRLPPEAPAQAEALLYFGRLIANTDMHFGNLSLRVARSDLAAGRFTLAPVYDMLPMRWRPDAATGLADYAAFEPDPLALASPARAPALVFWQRLQAHTAVSPELRQVAGDMAVRLRGSSTNST